MTNANDRRADLKETIRHLAPRIPRHECGAVLDHALTSKTLRAVATDEAVWLSLVAYVRHVHTDYDELLVSGYDVESVRHFVRDEINKVLVGWGVPQSRN